MDPKMDTLLNLDEPDGTPPPDEPADPPAPDGTPKPAKLDKRVQDLEETNKNLQEQMRQDRENNKTVQDFRDKILSATGSKDEDEKKKNQELLIEFDKNPIIVMDRMIKENIANSLGSVQDKVDLQEGTFVISKVMDNVDKKYVVDWDKDHPKIKAELKNFDKDAIKRDPSGTLIAACKLAGVIKLRDANTPPLVEPHTRSGSLPHAAGKTHEEEVNNRLNKIGQKGKSGNVFKL